MMEFTDLTTIFYVYEVLLYAVDSYIVKNGHPPIVDDDFVETVMCDIQAKIIL
jgi:hypothetical protein